MSAFNDKNFLLFNSYGKRLYHEVAAGLPIIDPHNHIDAAALAENRKFDNIYQLWVQNDPYKHRAMRIYGIDEELITGNKPDYEKFFAWAACFPHTIGNPLFHWSCMELKEVFGIKDLLTPDTAKNIWNKANKMLSKDRFGALELVKGLGVEMLCTSDDLTDTLEHHLILAREQNELTCLPSLRGDSIINFNQPQFSSWLDRLQSVSGLQVSDINSYSTAIRNRLHFFDNAGCLLSDHSLDSGFIYTPVNDEAANSLFKKVLSGETLTDTENIGLQSHLLLFLGKEYANRKWGMQLHIGAHRYTSTNIRNKVGPAGGYACIGNASNVSSICNFIDDLDKVNKLPKTILYTLNPTDNEVFASLTGSYSEDGIRGKIQFGPAWWYNDHYEGILGQLAALSSYGLLSTSIGMTTDSRSLLSFMRHDYYRRILCTLLGSWVEEGKVPDDWKLMSQLVSNISYNNIKHWIKK
jgi:glucuronate isomerase